MKQVGSFSYREAVSKTKMKLVDNCTDDVEDLFKRIFDPDPDTRITFEEIRHHPIFKKNFPD